MGADPLTKVETRVREEIRRRGVDPVRDGDAVRALVDEVLADWDQKALAGSETPVADRADAARTVLSNVAGRGFYRRGAAGNRCARAARPHHGQLVGLVTSRRLPAMRRVQRDDEGTIMLLTLGFTVLALLLVLVVAAATQVHLQRMRLTHVADEIALDAADSLDVGGYYAGNLPAPSDDGVITLADAAVKATAEERVADAAARAGLPPTEIVDALTADGFTATVTVRTVVHPLFAWTHCCRLPTGSRSRRRRARGRISVGHAPWW